jgi:predicted amidophosphoribosyltransferase
MPTYKHPCPHCGTFIARDVVACPACGRADPFVPGRCPKCQTPIDDLGWIACPKCGEPLAAAGGAKTPRAPAAPQATATSGPAPQADAAPGASRCAGCGSPLPANARFCRECGTLVG